MRFPLLSPLDFDPANVMRVLLIAAVAFSVSACNLVFKLPTRQGNVIEQKQLDQLKVGMTREQVTYLMGTPVAASPFRTDRWDYIGYYKSPRGKLSTRTVTVHFDANVVSRLDGAAPLADPDAGAPKAPEAAAIYKQQKKEKNEDARADEPKESGVILTQPSNTP